MQLGRETTRRARSRTRAGVGPPPGRRTSVTGLLLRRRGRASRLARSPEQEDQHAEENDGRLPDHGVRRVEESRLVPSDPHERNDADDVDDLDSQETEEEP